MSEVRPDSVLMNFSVAFHRLGVHPTTPFVFPPCEGGKLHRDNSPVQLGDKKSLLSISPFIRGDYRGGRNANYQQL